MSMATVQPTLELHSQQFIDNLAGAPPVYTLSPAAARSVLTRAQSIPVGKPSAQIEDIALPVGPTGSVPIRIIRPVGAAEILPVVMYFHGRRLDLGRSGHARPPGPREAVDAEAAVAFVDYDRAPEPTTRPLSSRLMPRPAMWPITPLTCASTHCGLPLRETRRGEHGGSGHPDGQATP